MAHFRELIRESRELLRGLQMPPQIPEHVIAKAWEVLLEAELERRRVLKQQGGNRA